LNIIDENKDVSINFEFDKWEGWVLSYCRISKLPQALEYFVYEKAKQSFLLSELILEQYKNQQKVIESEENAEDQEENAEVRSVSTGDTSITFLSKAESMKKDDIGFRTDNVNKTCEELCTRDEIKLLNRYRKVGWNGY